jgi:alginate O-acetyltransferase complex protein AlgI
MLFNSYIFLFGFFPLTLAMCLLLRRAGGYAPHVAMLAASLIFYGWWDIRFLSLLVSSLTLNYLAGGAIYRCSSSGRHRAAGRWMACAIILNLSTLAIFKYANFFLDNVNLAFRTDLLLQNIILPLGISFFTFEQISYLVDVRRGQTRPSLYLHYALFVSFFPRLVAGPILRYNEIAPQFLRARSSHLAEDLAVGLTMFFIGLLKKSLLADGIAPYAAPVFAAADRGEPLDVLIAWGGALAYTCQLYFDFSGYSDMAIGAARCFGIRFPMNFNSPYKAVSIIDFWRRWHMTLSRFLRDYLYFALGGNRRGPVRRYVNLFITMLLGGFWHGANWTFIMWGGLHGFYLIANHAWVRVAERSPTFTRFRNSYAWTAIGSTITFLAVVVAWVFFRAPNFSAAFNMLGAMAGSHGIVIPSGLQFVLEPVQSTLIALGIRFADGSGTILAMTYIWVVGLLAIALLLPNSQQLLNRWGPVLEVLGDDRKRGKSPAFGWEWQLSRRWAIIIGCIAFLGIISITRASEFLYWQF